MSKDLNKVQLTGRLGADPEMRYTAQGNPVTTFRVASNRSWRTTEGEQKEDTEWFSVVAWNKLAEICNQYLRKGSRVYVEGRSQTRSWEDTETGQTRYKTEIVANDMIMLDTRRDGASDYDTNWEAEPESEPVAVAAPPRGRRAAAPSSARTRSAARSQPSDQEDDLPF